jgi:hypothetical protein
MNLDTKIALEIIGFETGKINLIITTEFNVLRIYKELSTILGTEDIQLHMSGVSMGSNIPQIVKMFDVFDYTKPIIIVTNKESIYKHVITRPHRIIASKCPVTKNLHLVFPNLDHDVIWKFGSFHNDFVDIITKEKRNSLLEDLL